MRNFIALSVLFFAPVTIVQAQISSSSAPVQIYLDQLRAPLFSMQSHIAEVTLPAGADLLNVFMSHNRPPGIGEVRIRMVRPDGSVATFDDPGNKTAFPSEPDCHPNFVTSQPYQEGRKTEKNECILRCGEYFLQRQSNCEGYAVLPRFFQSGAYKFQLEYFGSRGGTADAGVDSGLFAGSGKLSLRFERVTLSQGQTKEVAVVNVGCPELAVPLLTQTDGRWNPPQYTTPYDAIGLPSGPPAIEQKGCALTSTAMVMKFHGFETDSGRLNDLLRVNHGYCGRQIHWGAAACLSQGKVDLVEVIRENEKRNGQVMTTDKLKEIMNEDLKNGNPVIVQVFPPPPKRTHWVVVSGPKCGDTWPIKDPNFPRSNAKTLKDDKANSGFNYNNGVFALVRYRKGTSAGCKQFLSVCAKSPIELLLTDPSANSTGFDSSSGNFIVNIPNSGYLEDGLKDDVTGDSEPNPTKQLYVQTPAQGAYVLKALGTGRGTYTIDFNAFDLTGNIAQQSFSGFTAPGFVSSFQTTYTASPGQPFQSSRAATFESTLQEIRLAPQQNLIDNDGIVNSLAKKIEAAREAKDKGQTDAAENILQAFLNELQAQEGKHIRPLAAQVLREDVEFLIKNLRSFP